MNKGIYYHLSSIVSILLVALLSAQCNKPTVRDDRSFKEMKVLTSTTLYEGDTLDIKVQFIPEAYYSMDYFTVDINPPSAASIEKLADGVRVIAKMAPTATVLLMYGKIQKSFDVKIMERVKEPEPVDKPIIIELEFDLDGGLWNPELAASVPTKVMEHKGLAEHLILNSKPATKEDKGKTYTFIGWDPAIPVVFERNSPTKFTALWQLVEQIEPVELHFDLGGGQFVGEMPNREQTEGDAFPDVPAPVLKGYIFAGWEPELPKIVSKGENRYTAKWELPTLVFTIDKEAVELEENQSNTDISLTFTEESSNVKVTAKSTPENIATVEYKDGKLIIVGKQMGVTTITLNATADDFKPAAPQTITVKVTEGVNDDMKKLNGRYTDIMAILQSDEDDSFSEISLTISNAEYPKTKAAQLKLDEINFEDVLTVPEQTIDIHSKLEKDEWGSYIFTGSSDTLSIEIAVNEYGACTGTLTINKDGQEYTIYLLPN